VDPETQRMILDLIGEGPSRTAQAARVLLPEMLGGGAAQNIVAAARGKTDIMGQPITISRALIESLLGKQRSLEEARIGAGKDVEELGKFAERQAARRARAKQ